MPRGTRFERDRIARLFGNQPKAKLIHKPAGSVKMSRKGV